MVKWILPFILSSAAFATAICESDLSRAQIAAVKVLRLSWKLRELSTEQIRNFGISQTWYNPLSDEARDPGNLSLKQKFIQHTRKMSDKEKAGVQAQALKLAAVGFAQDALVAEAREATDRILGYKFERDLLPAKYSLGNATIFSRVLQGRPLFIAKFQTSGSSMEYNTVALDPFHQDSEQQVFPDIQRALGFSNFGSYDFFERGGDVYAALLDQDEAYHLRTRGGRHRMFKVVSDLLGLEKLSHSEVIVESEEGHKAAVAFNNKPKIYFNRLMLFDLSGESKPQEVNVEKECHHLSSHVVNGRSYVTCAGVGHLSVYDVNDNRLIYSTTTIKTGLNLGDVERVLFAEGDDLYMAYIMRSDSSSKKLEVQIVNLKSKQSVPLPGEFEGQLNSRFQLVRVKGVPHLYFFFDNELVHVNLRTRESNRIPVSKGGNKSTPNFFTLTWRAHELLLWDDGNGSLQIFDADSESTLAVIRKGSAGVHPFVRDGELYALVSPARGGLHLYRLSLSSKDLK